MLLTTQVWFGIILIFCPILRPVGFSDIIQPCSSESSDCCRWAYQEQGLSAATSQDVRLWMRWPRGKQANKRAASSCKTKHHLKRRSQGSTGAEDHVCATVPEDWRGWATIGAAAVLRIICKVWIICIFALFALFKATLRLPRLPWGYSVSSKHCCEHIVWGIPKNKLCWSNICIHIYIYLQYYAL